MRRDIAEGIFDDWEEFARYGFNKSHAADYGVIAVQTAYLKANYPAEYLAALLSASAGQTEKVALYAADARSLGVPVLPPDINASSWDFDIEDTGERPSIRFGLGAIKNLGRTATEQVLSERSEHGRFVDLNDFARRVDLRATGKRGLECLIKVGALDAFGDRIAMLASLERIAAISANHFRARESGQLSLFGTATGVEERLTLPEVNQADKREILAWERELIGLYISDHPLTPYQAVLAKIATHFSSQLTDAQNGEQVRVAGLITVVRPYVTKAGKPMGFVTIEDIQGSIELVLFPRAWEKTRTQLATDQIVVVDGKVDTSNTPPKILVDAVRTDLESAAAERRAAAGCLRTRPTDSQWPRRHPSDRGLLIGSPRGVQSRSENGIRRSCNAKAPAQSHRRKTDFPPPPENFPADWETQWQPSFDNADVASRAPSSGDGRLYSVKSAEPLIAEASEAFPDPALAARAHASAHSIHVVGRPGGHPPRIPVLPSLYVPLEEDRPSPDGPPKQITILLRSTGDRERDRRRIKTIHGTLTSFHGKDRFSFHIFEDGRGVLLDFPAATTHVSTDLLARLEKLIGERSWRIEDITFH